MLTIEKIGESELEQKLLTLASWDNGIRMDVMVFVHFFLTQLYRASIQAVLICQGK